MQRVDDMSEMNISNVPSNGSAQFGTYFDSPDQEFGRLLSRRWYILHYHRSTLLLPLGERLLLVVVEWKREAK